MVKLIIQSSVQSTIGTIKWKLYEYKKMHRKLSKTVEFTSLSECDSHLWYNALCIDCHNGMASCLGHNNNHNNNTQERQL